MNERGFTSVFIMTSQLFLGFLPQGLFRAPSNRNSHFSKFFLPLLLCCAFSAANSQTSVPEFVVTASRTAQRVEDAMNSTTLIRREDIEKSLAADFPSLMQQVPGLEVVQTGGQGTVSSIFMRGAESRHTLVLVDGVPINNLNFGTAPIENLSLANIDHIEIVRGNVSSLYGSNALGGVIQIFTKEGTGKNSTSASYQLRDKNMSSLQAGTTLSLSEDTQLTLQSQTLRDAGINATNQKELTSTNPDQDGYSKKLFATGITKKFDRGQINLSFSDSHASSEYDSQYGPSNQRDISENALRQTSLNARLNPTNDIKIEALLSQSTNRLNAKVTAYPYFVNSSIDLANVGVEWSLGDHQKITSGLETTKQSLASDTQYKNNARTDNAYRLGYLIHSIQHQLQLNVRQDRYTDFGQSQTGLLAYAFKPNDVLRLNANLSNGFMAPTFNDLYYPYGGNPNLRPEKLTSNEFGFTLKNGLHSLQVTHFNNRYKDLIDNDSNYVRTNIASAQNIGTETIYSGNFKNRVVNASYTQQNPINLNTNQQLFRRAKYLLSASVSEKLDHFNLTAEIKNSSSRMDGVNHALGEYALMNLSVSKKIDQQWSTSAKVNNLFNKQYETIYGYNTFGRSLMLELKWQEKNQ